MKTVIVGNGILALTTAFRLAKSAAKSDEIVIIGKRSRPGSATLAAAAMLNSFAEIESGSLETEADFFHFELSHLATRMWPKFILDILEHASSKLPKGCSKCEGPCGGCYDTGTYLINNTAADELDDENFNAVINALKRFDEPYQEVDPNGIPNYSPEERYRAQRAIYIPSEGWLNPRLTLDVLDSAMRSFSQLNEIDDEAVKLRTEFGKIKSVLLSSGESVTGDQFLLCTGATVSDLLNESGIALEIPRIFYGIGASIELRSPDYPHKKCIRTPNRGLACGLYSVPFFLAPDVPHDSLLIGASNFISPVPHPAARAISVQALLKGAMEQINKGFYRASLTRVNVGWRPTSADTFPLLGRTSISNLVIASGTKRDGFHLSPVLSEMLSAELQGRPTDERYKIFRPERPLIRQVSRENGIRKAVRHLMSASYQHGFVPSHGRMIDQMKKMYREDLERLHDQVGALDWGIPVELLDMYRFGHIK